MKKTACLAPKDSILGIDVGSVSVDIVLLSPRGKLLHGQYVRHMGRPDKVLIELLQKVENDFNISYAAVTGLGASRLQRLLGAFPVNEIIAQAEAAKMFYPHVRSIIDIGGQDSKFIQLERDSQKENKEGIRIKDFEVSSMCASGTGSFLDQQAARLGLSIEHEFGESALRSKLPSRIAGRCSVFAKSDMIHMQQKGTPLDDIVAGLCHALVHGFKASVVGVKDVQTPVAFVGGVAANRGVVKAFENILEIEPEDIYIPSEFALAGALGAAVFLLNNDVRAEPYKGWALFSQSGGSDEQAVKRLAPLHTPLVNLHKYPEPGLLSHTEAIPAFLGIDVGSISTNIVLMDENDVILSKYYLMTASRPIDAVSKGFGDILKRMNDAVEIRGAAVTGSGRHLIGDLTGADIVVNEITAHARAAVFADPKADTIFEIGGQDSKYVHLSGGLVDDFTMNKACAAGTGSFLEEQAEKLGIDIKKDFAGLALSAQAPVDCGEQCTVFIETEVVRHQQNGVQLADITAGLAYSIATNYLHKVVENRVVGDRILFQGGVAFNTAVHAAFEKLTGKTLHVPQHHEVMGAIGCCLLVKEASQANEYEKTRFKGFTALKKGFKQESFQCDKCRNHCDINKIKVPGHRTLYYGGHCERYEVKGRKVETNSTRDLIKERNTLMFNTYHPGQGSKVKRGIIGYPRILTFHEYYPFFQAFFMELGFDILLSPPTNRNIIREGLSSVASPTCFPTKVAHGHAVWMKHAILNKEADFMFIPSLRETIPTAQAYPYANHCSYVQFLPDLVNDALNLEKEGIRLLKPTLHFRIGEKQVFRELLQVADKIGISNRKHVKRAFKIAGKTYHDFRRARIRLGREILASIPSDEKAVILAGKAHNIYDPGTNMNLAHIIQEMGVQVIPMDLLDLFHSPDVGDAWSNMTLAMGQRTLVVADMVRRDQRFQAVYLANFGCVNDSIYPRFFKRELGEKQFLLLEIDEHTAEAGVVTRCEAFLDAVRNSDTRKKYMPRRVQTAEYDPGDGRVLYLPHAANGMAVWAAALRAFGVRAETLPPPNERSLYWGRRCLDGKECLPCTLMTGDMLRIMKDEGIPVEKAAFFMPGSCGSCRYDLFNTLQKVVFEDHGLGGVVLVDEFKGANKKLHKIMSRRDYGMLAWRGFIAADIIEKLRLHTRPYEREPGTTDAVYHSCLKSLAEVVEKRRDIETAVQKSVDLFMTVDTDRSESRPVIGLVGEAYLRNVDYASNYIIQKLEMLGAEVRMPAIMEVLWYTLYKQRYYRDQSGNKFLGILLRLQHRMLSGIEKKLRRHTESILPNAHESRIWDVIGKSGFSLDAGLGFGAAVEIAQCGVNGLVHAIPFNCVPGLMIQGLESRFRRLFPHIPILTVAFHGQDDPGVETRLEALVHQGREAVRIYGQKKTAVTV